MDYEEDNTYKEEYSVKLYPIQIRKEILVLFDTHDTLEANEATYAIYRKYPALQRHTLRTTQVRNYLNKMSEEGLIKKQKISKTRNLYHKIKIG